MAKDIEIVCTNPDEIKLQVSIELPICQWRRILELVSSKQYYTPLDEILIAIRRGIIAIESREAVSLAIKPEADV